MATKRPAYTLYRHLDLEASLPYVLCGCNQLGDQLIGCKVATTANLRILGTGKAEEVRVVAVESWLLFIMETCIEVEQLNFLMVPCAAATIGDLNVLFYYITQYSLM